ncbi:MAG TPA: hypothetical protein EYP11_06065 [Aquificaceae bacterium]|nr:hypothetical protein [Aquificaceae bacterium]
MVEEKLRVRDIEAALKEVREYAPDYEGAIKALKELLDYVRRLKAGDEVIVVDPEDRLLGVGRLRLT